jgi:hypothetical protein
MALTVEFLVDWSLDYDLSRMPEYLLGSSSVVHTLGSCTKFSTCLGDAGCFNCPGGGGWAGPCPQYKPELAQRKSVDSSFTNSSSFNLVFFPSDPYRNLSTTWPSHHFAYAIQPICQHCQPNLLQWRNFHPES